MSDKTGIEWTDATWNPIAGCSLVSPGCTNCYAMKMAHRVEAMATATGTPTHYAGTTKRLKTGAVWTGRLNLAPMHILTQPLRWTRPRRIFVNSMSDLFHEDMPDEWRDKVFAIMAATPHHTYQVLTKRPERMKYYVSVLHDEAVETTVRFAKAWPQGIPTVDLHIPLPNLWLGVSVEDQRRADERIHALSQTPAAVRFLSAEPLLGPIRSQLIGIDWVIVGGESGPGARPMHPKWARLLRDHCQEAGVPFFFKQWGEWVPSAEIGFSGHERKQAITMAPYEMMRVGKKTAGRTLDGRTWDEMPFHHARAA